MTPLRPLRSTVPLAILTLAALALALLPFAARGQTVPTDRDTSHVATQRRALDSLRLTVKPQLDRYCASKNPLSYLKAACPIFNRNLTRLVAAESALVAGTVTPPIVAVASVSVSLAASTLTVGATTQATAVTRDASSNILSGRVVAWSSSAPSIAAVSGVGVVSALSAGTASIRATSEAIVGSASLTVNNVVVPAQIDTATPGAIVNGVELPRVFLTTTVASTPSAGRTLTVANGGNLQAALDSAIPGDRIVAAASATYSGNFTIGVKSGGISGGWITVTTSGSCPAEGTRVSPTTAATFPKVVTPNVNPALSTVGAAARWRFQCVELAASTSITQNNLLVQLGTATETSLSDLPTDIIFDRVYIHGHATLDTRRALAFNSRRTAIVDSDCREIHSAFDAQCVGGWNGPGPFKIVNNYLEAAAEVINFGGAGPTITNVMPADMEIRRNHITKQMAWKGTWLLKNLIEFKTGGRVLIEGNVLENSPADAQQGYAFVLTSAKIGTACLWCQTFDVTIRNNIVRNVGAGFVLAGKGWSEPAPLTARIAITQNVFLGVANPDVLGAGRLFQIADGVIAGLVISHNTMFTPSNSTWIFGPDIAYPGLTITNNLTGGGVYQLYAPAGLGTPAWNQVAGTGSAFLGNVVALTAGTYPSGNFYPATLDAIGLVGGGSAAYSVTASVSDLGLTSSSAYKGRATDGTDPGANIAGVLAATAGVKP